MALETLKDVEEIGGFAVSHINFLATGKDFKNHIWVNHGTNTIGFKIQKGPIKEEGVNGCQVDTMIEAAKLIIQGLNEKFPCHENEMVLVSLHSALDWLSDRTGNRMGRGVEGTSQV